MHFAYFYFIEKQKGKSFLDINLTPVFVGTV